MSIDHQIEYFVGDTAVSTKVWWPDPDDTTTLVDFSTGYTFQVKVGKVGAAAAFTKTTNITGAAGSGDGNTAGDTPNITINWAASAELSTLAAGVYTVQIRAIDSGTSETRTRALKLKMIDVIT